MNKIILTGNIVADNKSGDKMVRNAIAVRREFKNEEGEYDSDFFDIIAFSHQAEFIKKYIGKGDKVELVGRMQVRTYQTQDGITRKSYEVVVESISILTKKQTANNLEEITDADFDLDDTNDIPF